MGPSLDLSQGSPHVISQELQGMSLGGLSHVVGCLSFLYFPSRANHQRCGQYVAPGERFLKTKLFQMLQVKVFIRPGCKSLKPSILFSLFNLGENKDVINVVERGFILQDRPHLYLFSACFTSLEIQSHLWGSCNFEIRETINYFVGMILAGNQHRSPSNGVWWELYAKP